MLSISDVINVSKKSSDVKGNLSISTNENIENIEKFTMDQTESKHWLEYHNA